MYDHTALARQINIEVRYDYIDKIAVRITRDISKSELRFLQDNVVEFVDYRQGHYTRGFVNGVLTIVAPKPPALQFLADLPDRTIVNYLEVARDYICDEGTKWLLRDLFDRHLVQPWHGRHVQVREENGSYTSQDEAPRKFVWYADKPCKLTGDVDCFHLEGRHVGVVQVSKLGIHHPRGLLSFDFAKYWQKHLHLYDIDLERLGRYHLNQQSGSRRQQPMLQQCGPITYNRDRATGCVLFKSLSAHPEQHCRSMQRFVDVYGRGPFLLPLHYIVNATKSILFSDTLLTEGSNVFSTHSDVVNGELHV